MYNKMVRQTKTKTSESVVPDSVVPQVVAPVDGTVPVEKVKKARSVKPVKTVSAPVNPEPSVLDAQSNVVSADPEVDNSLTEQSTELLAKIQQLGSLISAIKVEYRNIEKKWTRELKVAQKLSSKRKRKAGNRAPSGFVKPTKISDELAKFLEKPSGFEMARTEVTRDINKYIRNNNLQDKENGRKINPDKKLSTLLKLKSNDELTYFNLQKYMSPHFAKAAPKEVVVSSV